MKKAYKIALLSLASCFAVIATLSTYSAKLGRNIEASAQVDESGDYYITLPFNLGSQYTDGSTVLCGAHDYVLALYSFENTYALYTADNTSNSILEDTRLTYNQADTSDFVFTDYFYDMQAVPFSASVPVVVEGSVTYVNGYSGQKLFNLDGGYLIPSNYELTIDFSVNYVEYYFILNFLDLRSSEIYSCIEINFIYSTDEYFMSTQFGLAHFGDINSSWSYTGVLTGFLFEDNARMIVDYRKAYTQGTQNGYKNGYAQGYNDGISTGGTDGLSFNKLIYAVVDVPINAVRKLLGFQLLGVDLSSFFFGLLSVCLVLSIIKLIL